MTIILSVNATKIFKFLLTTYISIKISRKEKNIFPANLFCFKEDFLDYKSYSSIFSRVTSFQALP